MTMSGYYLLFGLGRREVSIGVFGCELHPPRLMGVGGHRGVGGDDLVGGIFLEPLKFRK
jgi:hypothetical protein